MERKKAGNPEFFSDGEWHTAPEVAYALGILLTNASERLRAYRYQGPLRRRKTSKKFNLSRICEYTNGGKGMGKVELVQGGKVGEAQES